MSFSSYNGYKLNSHLTCFPWGAQLVEHCTSIAEIMGSNPSGASEFFLGFLCNCLSDFITARITFTCSFMLLFTKREIVQWMRPLTGQCLVMLVQLHVWLLLHDGNFLDLHPKFTCYLITNFRMLFLIMELISLVDGIKFLLISSWHFCTVSFIHALIFLLINFNVNLGFEIVKILFGISEILHTECTLWLVRELIWGLVM